MKSADELKEKGFSQAGKIGDKILKRIQMQIDTFGRQNLHYN